MWNFVIEYLRENEKVYKTVLSGSKRGPDRMLGAQNWILRQTLKATNVIIGDKRHNATNIISDRHHNSTTLT